MKSSYFIYVLVLCSTTLSCSSPNRLKNPAKWNDQELNDWFNKREWEFGREVEPDESIDRKVLAVQFFKKPERWEKAFQFLKNKNLETLKLGTYELDGKNVYAIVQEYLTKDEDGSRFEAHKQYADIHYVVEGEEKIGVVPLVSTTVNVPYDSTKDVAYLTASSNNYQLASQERFFVFFPNDAHRPGVKVNNNLKVKKIVVKVLLDFK